MKTSTEGDQNPGAPNPAEESMRAINKFIAYSGAVLAAGGALIGFAATGLTGLWVGALIGIGIMAVPASIFMTYARLGQAMNPQQPAAAGDSRQEIASGPSMRSVMPGAARKFNEAATRIKSSAAILRRKLAGLLP